MIPSMSAYPNPVLEKGSWAIWFTKFDYLWDIALPPLLILTLSVFCLIGFMPGCIASRTEDSCTAPPFEK